ncbi:hypothetical protein CBR_g38496 [Chara braunii]|uniref:Reverse transcriptase n=1 Tax=Chara braunii TaxID=69332 RepID=A0A388JP39_CHABU|nr:hypothetical protein CBR_g38496 [Chara braunii]|eukprot:GBG59472.1 hypothetical protein CBR_g38496 [Chara braunii]
MPRIGEAPTLADFTAFLHDRYGTLHDATDALDRVTQTQWRGSSTPSDLERHIRVFQDARLICDETLLPKALLINRFVVSLPTDYRIELWRQSFASAEQAYEAARQYQKMRNCFSDTPSSSRSTAAATQSRGATRDRSSFAGRFRRPAHPGAPFSRRYNSLEYGEDASTPRRYHSSAYFDVLETGYDFILGTPWSRQFRGTEAEWATETLVLKTKCGQTHRVPFIGTTGDTSPDLPPQDPRPSGSHPNIAFTSPRQFAHFIRQEDVTFYSVNVMDLLRYDPLCPEVELIFLEPDPPDPPSIFAAPIFTSTRQPADTSSTSQAPAPRSTHTSRTDADAEELTRFTTDLEPAVRDLIREYRDVFPPYFSYSGIPSMRGVEHSIQLVPDYRVHHQAPYRLSIPEATELKRNRFFTKIDLRSGYHQICVATMDQPKTAFRSRFGHYEFTVMPFGLTNASATFQTAMNDIFRDILEEYVLVYLDDILVYSRTLEDHLKHVRDVLPIAEWSVPTSAKQLRSFLGLTSYYSNFIQGYARYSYVLTSTLLRKNLPWFWTPLCEDAFRALKKAVTCASVLRLPDFDRPFIVTTDASDFAVGAVLSQLRVQAVAEFHDQATAGHMGFHKTLARVCRLYVWPKSKDFVKAYIQECPTCQEVNSANHLPYGLLQPLPIPEGRWQSISMDFIGPLRPPTERGHDAILVVVDRFTKRARFVPCRYRISAREVADIVFDRVVRDHDLPQSIISDRDPRFTSTFWRRLHEVYGSQLRFSSSYHPQTDGQTEVANKALGNILRKFVRDDQQWDLHLAHAEIAYNHAVSPATGMSPFYCDLGYHPRVPADFLRPSRLCPDTRCPALDDWIAPMAAIMKRAHESLADSETRMAARANRLRMDHPFKVGDDVLVDARHLQLEADTLCKLRRRFFSPCRILKAVGSDTAASPVSFRVKLPDYLRQARVHDVYHVSLLRPYRRSSERFAGCLYERPPPIMVDGHEEFVVSDIVSRRVTDNTPPRIEYLVRWKGYPDEEATWEPLEHLQHARMLV